MLGRRVFLAAALPVVLVVSGATDAVAATASHQARSSSAADLRTMIRELVEMPGGPPGVAVVVQRGNVRHFYHGGVAKIGGHAPRIGEHMRIASVAKAFNGATAMVLVDKGVLRLQDTIGHWLPGLPKTWHRITLRQLLQHTSGLPDIADSQKFLAAVGASPHHAARPRTIVSFVFGEKLNFPPGTQYGYSNTDNLVAAMMIQKATGRSYFHELQKNVLRPLHLGRTSLPLGPRMPRPYIHGYEFNRKTNRPTVDVSQELAAGWAWSSGGVVSTPGDLNRFVRGYVSGRLVSARTKELWHRLLIPGGSSHPIGPGLNFAGPAIYRYQTSCGTVYGHTGNVLGYAQFALSTLDGTRSATVSINMQVSHHSGGPKALVFKQLERVVEAAVCTATR